VEFRADFERTLTPGMVLPPALAALFDWVEARGLVVTGADGRRYGTLYPDEDVRRRLGEDERPGGTCIELVARGNADLHYWFGRGDPEIVDRLCVFAQTGGEGSQAALWLDPDGNQRIVHLGSGSGSTLTCVLADDAVDFLRLLAIGYDEICWPDDFDRPPCEVRPRVLPNVAFQNWVTSAFGVDIPKTASAIVKHPANASNTKGGDSPDPFWRWVARATA
jgi:hypothetical protein